MNRFCVPPETLTLQDAELPGEIARQVTRVLRLRPGDRIALFSGDGWEVEASLLEVTAGSVRVRLGRRSTPDTELDCRLRVALAVLKGEKLDWTIQKLTELGATEIQLLTTDRTISSPGEERWPRRLDRYRRIAREAAEQCGAIRLPELHEPADLTRFLASTTGEGDEVILDPGAEVPLSSHLQTPLSHLTMLIGPEGGFSEREIRLAVDHGVRRVSLGRRTLRAETAAIAAAALVSQLARPAG